MKDPIKESVELRYQKNGVFVRVKSENLHEEDLEKLYENFLVMCGLKEPKSYLNSKDLVEKIKTEWSDSNKK